MAVLIPLIDIVSVFFTDSLKGWIAESELFHINDGGGTWDSINYPIGSGMNDVFFINEFVGFTAQYNGDIYFTKNGRQSWTNENASSDNNSVNDIYCMGVACYAVGDNDLILKRNVLTYSVDEQYSTAFNIFPNPTSGNITINISENGKNNNSSFVTV